MTSTMQAPIPPETSQYPRTSKRWYQRVWVWLGIAAALMLIAGGIIAAFTGGGTGMRVSVNPPVTTPQPYTPQPYAPPQAEQTTPPSAPTHPLALKFGQAAPITVSDTATGAIAGRGDYTVTAVVPYTWQYGTPENGRWLALDVTIKATSGSVDYSPFDWQLQTADDRVWQASGMQLKKPVLSLGKVSAGQTVRGWITFDISTSPVTQVQLADSLRGTIATWTQ